ncbi:MAG: ABC transporter permease [Gemmatimonadales bacterium]|nr:ABC transporter permease [Gemmatimonadales bacterium]
MDHVRQDLRYALRSLARSPAYACVAIASLALGIAGNAVLFTFANGLLFKPLPVGEPDRVAALYTSDFSGTRYGASSYPDLVSFRAQLPAFDHVVGMQLVPTSLFEGGNTSRIVAGLVSADFITGMGIPLALGPGFRPDQERPGADAHTVVLSHALWRARFGGDPAIVGRSVTLGGQPFTVAGVARPGFSGLLRGIGQDAWVPFGASGAVNPGNDFFGERGNRSLLLFGHLAPGATLAQATEQAAAAARALRETEPAMWSTLDGAGRDLTVLPEAAARVFPDARMPVVLATLLLFLVVGAVLLIACANVANLSLGRALARRREIAIRIALGAERRRLVAQLLTESLLVALAGGALGLGAAAWLHGLVSSLQLPLPVPVSLDLTLDGRVLGFTLVVSLIAGLVLGLAPALQATRPSLIPALKDQGALLVMGRSWLRSLLVATQVAFVLPLIALAFLFGRSLARASALDPGFGARDGLVLATDWGLTGWSTARGHQFQRELAERVRALPGVTAAGLTETLPLSLGGNRSGMTPEGYAPAPSEDMEAGRVAVGPGYFEALELPLLEGRRFTDTDAAGAPGVAIVNAAFAARYWPGGSAIGRRLSYQGPEAPWVTVVGVAGDVTYGSPGTPAAPCFYLPLAQVSAHRTTLVVRSAGDPLALAGPVREVIRDLDPALPVEGLGTLKASLALSLLPARIGGVAAGAFGLLGLLLASLGVYGVVAFGVGQRRREIGIRLALGAGAAQVVRQVVGDGLRQVVVGVCVGVALTIGASLVAHRVLFGLAPLEPVALLGGPALFLAAALLAAWLPARRAAAIDPLTVLRAE